jgi:glycine C-acetyltransferase
MAFSSIVVAVSGISYIMVKDLFERIQNNKGPLGKWASQAEGYFVFPKLEGELGPRMKFQGKDILNWSLNDYLGLANHPEVRKADTDAAIAIWCSLPNGCTYDEWSH